MSYMLAISGPDHDQLNYKRVLFFCLNLIGLHVLHIMGVGLVQICPNGNTLVLLLYILKAPCWFESYLIDVNL